MIRRRAAGRKTGRTDLTIPRDESEVPGELVGERLLFCQGCPCVLVCRCFLDMYDAGREWTGEDENGGVKEPVRGALPMVAETKWLGRNEMSSRG